MTGTRFTLELQPVIPQGLKGLKELAEDLMYSWDRQVRRLLWRLDPELWEACGHNPKVFLRRVSQVRLLEADQDSAFKGDYNRVLAAYNTYHKTAARPALESLLDPGMDLIAYFCAEFGFHESFPIYSGGLGILAGDYCKAASDLCIPFVAVGLLYRQGYFTQTIDAHGNQIAHYTPMEFADLPVTPATGANGAPLQVEVELPGREVALKVWQAKAGHIKLYLLDSDLPANSEEDRATLHRLYGGDHDTRIKQEILLGIGGVRALRALGLRPTVWHINEGHAAFQVLERCRERVAAGMKFEDALEIIAAGTVFTTHTPVPAGHDIFDQGLIMSYFKDFISSLGIDVNDFMRLGSFGEHYHSFNMTALALRGSRFHNGVSHIHGGVASRMESYVWPQIPAEENPIGYVTNGVHLSTFLAREWGNLFDMRFSDWRSQLLNADYWRCIDDIPDHRFWSLRQELKTLMLEDLYRRVVRQSRRNGYSDAQIRQMTRYISAPTNILILGFARRFATYKRAALLFSDVERIARLLNDPKHPVLLVFAGKAHPNDRPGQHLIQTIHEYARRPEFLGKVLLLEGYDTALARRLVAGVDVWINTPEYPLEASGTSGQKAAINGVINLSVLDGWWAEGYNGENGWAITPHGPHIDAHHRNYEEARELMDILEKEVVPLYYDRDHYGYSEAWVRMSKASMKSIIPRFNAQRMVMDYVTGYYTKARDRRQSLVERDGAPAVELARWKRKVRELWPGVKLRRVDKAATAITYGQNLAIRVSAYLNGLIPEDVTVECLLGKLSDHEEFKVYERLLLNPEQIQDEHGHLFCLEMRPNLAGLQYYELRMYPRHRLLCHPFEMGLMVWL
jgi:starch phosphorylase